MKLIIANWKLHPKTVKAARQLIVSYTKKSRHTLIVSPPLAFVGSVDYPRLAAQDCFYETEGAYTGQVSAVQLRDLEVKYCIVGHSEKRALGETDADVSKKVIALLKARIMPIVCVGFGTSYTQSKSQMYTTVLKQLLASVPEEARRKVVVAYEPVWSISHGDPHATKHIENAEHASDVASHLKKEAKVSKVIYGGSVTEENAHDFLQEKALDGLLVGGASLKAKEFNAILAS